MARNVQGDFIWYELMTPDPEGAAAFYGEVVGWTTSSPPGGVDRGYRLWHSGGTAIGGMLELSGTDGSMPPNWAGYVGVDDVDASAAAILSAGGRQFIAPTDIPGVGRFAFVADPQGVPFYIMRGTSDQVSTAFDPMAAGHCNWNEMATPVPDEALAFWGARFGWRKSGAMPMGENGDYTFVDVGGRAIGAVFRAMDGRPPSFLFYFGVPDIDRAHGALQDGGGTVHFGPSEVPGGRFIIVATDPEGAWFGLVGPRKGGQP
ncbi:MAG: VOC family protein [Paracoccaceae bacterium]